MVSSQLTFIALVAISTFSLAASLKTRQDQIVERYITQLDAALVVIDTVRNGCIDECCSNVEYLTPLYEQGYDIEIVNLLLCEMAVGFNIFPDIDHAEEEYLVAYDGLTRVAANPGDPSQPLFCRENSLDVDAFENGGLDGDAIARSICGESLLGLDEAIVSMTTTRGTNGASISATQSATSVNRSPASSSISPMHQPQMSPSAGTTGFDASLSFAISSLISSSRVSSSTASRSPSTQSGSNLSSPTPPFATTTTTIQATSSQTKAATDNFSLVVVTTLVTVTVTPIPLTAPTTLTHSTDAPMLPPLRFTLASRIVPAAGDPVVMPAATTELPNWTIGPPLGFTRTSGRSTAEFSSATTISDA